MTDLQKAVNVLKQGGVIAYPTEYCFGLGCDPLNTKAIQRILAIKRRQANQGLILIAADIPQLEFYVNLSSAACYEDIIQSWPGPYTWTIEAKQGVSEWVRGMHESVAVRVPNHMESHELCRQFGDAIVSTSANRHGESELMTTQQVRNVLGDEVDHVVDAMVGGAVRPSQIRDGNTGERFR